MTYYPALLAAALGHGLSSTIMRICRLRSRASLELWFVMAIIVTLMTLAAKSYRPAIGRAKVASVMLGAAYSKARSDAITYYAANGQWPEDTAAALSQGWHDNYEDEHHAYVREASVSRGGIHLHLAGDTGGSILTVRPALPARDPATVIWVCGDRRPADLWTVVGEDQTTLDRRYINRYMW